MRIDIPENKKKIHETIISIRWGDMDSYRHINNTVYFRYMEQARIEWITSLGFSCTAEKARERECEFRCKWIWMYQ